MPGAADGEPVTAHAKLFGRDFILVCSSCVCVFASTYVIVPGLPAYVKALGGADAIVGLVVSFFTLAAVIARLPVGRALDVGGRKRILVAGGVVVLLSALGFNFAHDILSLLVLRFLQGAGLASMTTAAVTLATDLAPVKRRGEAMGYWGLAPMTALAMGPVIGVQLLGVTGFPLEGFALLVNSAALVAAMAVILAACVREPKRPRLSRQRFGTRPGDFFVGAAMPPSIAMAIQGVPWGPLFSFVPLYVAQDSPQNVAAFFLAYALTTLLSRPLAGIASDRFGRRAVLVPAMAIAGLAMVILAISPTLPMVITAGIAYGVGFGMIYPALLALTSDSVPPAKRGVALSNVMASCDLGQAIGAVALGLVAQAVGYSLMFFITALCVFLGLLYFVLYPKLLAARKSAVRLAPSGVPVGDHTPEE